MILAAPPRGGAAVFLPTPTGAREGLPVSEKFLGWPRENMLGQGPVERRGLFFCPRNVRRHRHGDIWQTLHVSPLRPIEAAEGRPKRVHGTIDTMAARCHESCAMPVQFADPSRATLRIQDHFPV